MKRPFPLVQYSALNTYKHQKKHHFSRWWPSSDVLWSKIPELRVWLNSRCLTGPVSAYFFPIWTLHIISIQDWSTCFSLVYQDIPLVIAIKETALMCCYYLCYVPATATAVVSLKARFICTCIFPCTQKMIL